MKKTYLLFALGLMCGNIFSQSLPKVVAEQFSPISFLHSIFIDENNNEMYVGKIAPKGLSDKKIFRLTPNGDSTVVAETECWYITAINTDNINNLYVGAGNNDGKWKLLKITPDSAFSVLAENLPEFGRIQFNKKGDVELVSDTVYLVESNGKVAKTNRRQLWIDDEQKCGYRLDKWSGNYVIKFDVDENYNVSNPDTVIYDLPYAHGITLDDEGTVYVFGYQDDRNVLAIYNKDMGEKRFLIDNNFYCPPGINYHYIITGLLKGKGDFGRDYLYFLVASEGVFRINISELTKM